MRLADWDVRLADWAQSALGRRFCWGKTDCALLAFEAFDALTGGDLAGAYRGQYAGSAGARAFMRRWDIDAARVLRASGCRDVHPAFAQRGDIILANDGQWLCAHVCLGARLLMAPRGGRVGYGELAPLTTRAYTFALRVI